MTATLPDPVDDRPTRFARRTFLDAARQRAFERDGFVIVPVLEPTEVEAARAIFATLDVPAAQGFQTDFEMADPERKRLVHDQVVGLLGDRLDATFDDHRPFMTSFLAKWPGPGSALYVHQDWAYVDERAYRSVVMWVALDDTSPERGNGPLLVLPGSHRIAGEHRGTSTTPWHAHHPQRIADALVPVSCPAGSAVIMDNALVHASPDNETAGLRLAVAVAYVPGEAPLIHAVGRADGTVDVLAVTEEFFRQETPSRLREHVPAQWPVATSGEAASWSPPDLREAERRCGASLDGDEPLGSSAPSPPSGSPVERAVGAALAAHHRRIQRRIGDVGPFLDPQDVAPWAEALERDHTAICDEYVAATADRAPVPLGVLAGADLPNVGSWLALVLKDNTGWNPDAVAACPVTAGHLRSVPGLRSAMFSVLAPGARIDPHRGVNKGVLRAHLGVIVPEPPSLVTLWAGSERVAWSPGGVFVFDDTYEHRVANRTAGWRVSLMVEFDRPLHGVDRVLNGAVQQLFRLHPQVRGAARRRRAVAAALAS
ncbi:MAG TPA: aspartyl/asparaginyl beta-hydroxylase domain-containing protein [Acidimicrobiales bacterium]|nr:aspartyl/asparaginyl beta-hydroxylase domain-containing protein [Acidimicrobiales bacterium]